MSPPKGPNTTILKLYLLSGQYTASTNPDESFKNITDATQEGKALLEFLTSIDKEPGHDYTMWGRVRELEDCLFIFIGNDDDSMPSSQEIPD